MFDIIYIKIKAQVLKKYNVVAKKSKLNWRKILGESLGGSMPAEKPGHDQFIF